MKQDLRARCTGPQEDRSLISWRALAALAAGAPLIALAQGAPQTTVTVTRLSAAQAAQLAPTLAGIRAQATAQRAAVDAQTGELRPGEHDDSDGDAKARVKDTARTNAATAAMSATTAGKVLYNANGAVGMRFDPEFLNFARAKRDANGQIDADCVEALPAAAVTGAQK